MQNILCVCNTYFQLIVAIQLRLKKFNNDKMTLVISDHSNNSDKIFSKIKEMNLFDDCYYVYTKPNQNKIKLSGIIKRIMRYIIGDDSLWCGLRLPKIDEIIYFNQDINIFSLFAVCYRKNQSLKVSRMEEGVFAYGEGIYNGKLFSIIRGFRKLIRKKNIEDLYCNFYCFYPELYKGGMNPVEIPLIDSELEEVLKNVFDTSNLLESYKEKYIFFTSMIDYSNSKTIDEIGLIEEIADLVGKENLLVKVHPRDDMNKFINRGLNVDKNSMIPWEVIQMGCDFSNHIFLTVNSTSVLSVSLLQSNPPKICYLYELFQSSEILFFRKVKEIIDEIIQSDVVRNSNVDIYSLNQIKDVMECENRK